MFPGQAPSGQWARTRNTESAELFLEEKQQEEQRQQAADRRRAFGGNLRDRIGLVAFGLMLVGLLVLGVLGN